MTGKIDVELVQELVAKLEWAEMALAGDLNQKGLLDRLETLFTDIENPEQLGVLQKIENLLTNASDVHQQLSDVQNALQEPFSLNHVNELKEAVSAAVRSGTHALQEELRDINKATKLASDRIVNSASQSEISLRSASEDLKATEESLQQTLPIATQQLKKLLHEALEVLGSDHSLSTLKTKIKDLTQEIVLDKQDQALRESWEGLQQRFLADQAVTLQRQVEAIQEIVIETQTENLENVKKLIDHRTPSNAIVQLFQQLDIAKSENLVLKEKLGEPLPLMDQKQPWTEGVLSMVRSSFPFLIVSCCLGVVIGAGAMWGLLIGFR